MSFVAHFAIRRKCRFCFAIPSQILTRAAPPRSPRAKTCPAARPAHRYCAHLRRHAAGRRRYPADVRGRARQLRRNGTGKSNSPMSDAPQQKRPSVSRTFLRRRGPHRGGDKALLVRDATFSSRLSRPSDTYNVRSAIRFPIHFHPVFVPHAAKAAIASERPILRMTCSLTPAAIRLLRRVSI